jgi:hypothetical protein
MSIAEEDLVLGTAFVEHAHPRSGSGVGEDEERIGLHLNRGEGETLLIAPHFRSASPTRRHGLAHEGVKWLERATLWGGRQLQKEGDNNLSTMPARSASPSLFRGLAHEREASFNFNSDECNSEDESRGHAEADRVLLKSTGRTYASLSEALRDARPGDELLLESGVHSLHAALELCIEGVTIKPNPARDSDAMVEIVLTSTGATLLCTAANIRIEQLRIVQASHAGARSMSVCPSPLAEAGPQPTSPERLTTPASADLERPTAVDRALSAAPPADGPASGGDRGGEGGGARDGAPAYPPACITVLAVNPQP